MRLGNVQFFNDTGFTAQIFIKLPDEFGGREEDVAAHATSTALNGVLLTIDFVQPGADNVSFDFTNYLPTGLWVEDESPYRLSLLTDGSGNLSLLIRDNAGEKVGEFRPAG